MKTLLSDFTKVIERSVNGDQIDTILKINAQHQVFKGHFPNMPILPGVLITQLFKEEVEHLVYKELTIFEIKQIKFLKTINPEEDSIIQLKISLNFDTNIVLKGEMIHQDQIASKVRLTLKES